MIHAFNFTCFRDMDLCEMMIRTFNKHCPTGSISISNTDVVPEFKGYQNGSGWPQSLMKVKAMSDILKTQKVADDDFILSVDSDVVFCSPEVFKYVNPEYGIIGTRHRPEYRTHFGPFGHMSGALIFLRGDIAKKICALDEPTLTGIRFQQFKPFNLTENEDVVLSYLAKFVGANYFDLGTVPGLSSGDFEGDVVYEKLGYNGICGKALLSFYHLAYCPTYFIGETVAGKWDIPKVLKLKGIEL